uniref:Selenoprotein H n=1 Tax=Aegilops tauschii subsp. strangulata TaxID=200361 RepID=A0A453HUH9_AEGTS
RAEHPPQSTNLAMPPKRKSPVATAAAPAMPPRMTRSMAAGKRGADAPAKKEEAEAAPAAAGGKGRKKAKKEVSAVETVLSPPAAAKQKVKKNAKKEVVAAAVDDGGAGAESGKRVIVEAWTQCQQFKRRALKVKEDLESAVPGVSVTINPEKVSSRGCLEIREEGGDVFISLQRTCPGPSKR